MVLTVQGFSAIDTVRRDLVDTDGYMRAVRVVELVDGSSGWFDGSARRANTPYGHEMHWTRPMDAVLAAAASPWLAAGDVPRDAVYRGSLLAGPLLMVAIGLVVAWAAVPLTGRHWAPLAGAIAVAQPAISAYTAPGRSDHHGLILLMATITAGSVIRLLGRERRRVEILGGLALGFGMWVSVESMFVLGVVGLAAGAAWLVDAVDGRRVGRLWWSASLALACALLLERGSGWTVVEFDRLSVAHVALVWVVALTWWLVTAVARGRDRWTDRLAVAAPASAAAIAVFVVAFPGFLSGPFGAYPEDLVERWLSRVVELRPLFDTGAGTALALIAVPLAGLVVGGLRAGRTRPPDWRWIFVTAWIAASVGLSVGQLRWVMYAQLLAPVAVAAIAPVATSVWSERGRPVRLAGMVALIMLMLAGWRLPLYLPEAGSTDEPIVPCDIDALAAWIPNGSRVLAAIDHGPEILWRTSADVVASPYHRNVDGILDTLDAFEGDESLAKAIVDERGVEVVAVCPTVDGKDYPNAGSGSLFTRLVAGDPPEWLVPAGDPDDAGGFLVFRVVS
jgi:hypothetical protein